MMIRPLYEAKHDMPGYVLTLATDKGPMEEFCSTPTVLASRVESLCHSFEEDIREGRKAEAAKALPDTDPREPAAPTGGVPEQGAAG
jgi:hypothetical protein